MNNYIDIKEPIKWNYLRGMVEKSDTLQQETGSFRISTGINKPRHVFVFIINAANENLQTQNKFLYNTFNVANDQQMQSCHLEVGTGREYPRLPYKPSTEQTRVFRDVLRYVHANSRFGSGQTSETFFHLFTLI